MKTKSTFLVLIMCMLYFFVGAQSTPTEITAEYGPPDEADVWTYFSIPLTAESFNIDQPAFEAAMASVTSFWIRTEMHTGNDVGHLDDVVIGDELLSSYFNASAEGWSSGGDGTMEWINDGGIATQNGHLQISDWATGDWHWLIAPSNWAGDWSSAIGDSIKFYFKTDRPSYAAIIKITTGEIDRLVINTPVSNTILPDDSVLIQIEVLPAPSSDIVVSFSSSSPDCVTVPPPITVSAGNSSRYVYFSAAEGATINCESVIEATSPGYLTSRMTMSILDNYGVEEIDLSKTISIFPNPCNGKFTLSNSSAERIQQLMMYNLSGNKILDLQDSDLSNTEIDVTSQASGIYFLRMFVEDKVVTSKVVIK